MRVPAGSLLQRRTGSAAAAGTAGVLVALSVPPFGWWPLGWAGLGVIAWMLPGRAWRDRLLVGAAFGLGDYLPGLWWVHEFSVAGYVAVVVVSTLYAMAALLLCPSRREGWVAAAFPCLFLLSDFARDHFPLGGLPLAGTALGQAAGPLVPAVRLGGSVLLTGETALAGVVLAGCARAVLRRWGQRRRSPRWEAPRWLAAAALVAVALPLAGWLSPSGAGGRLPAARVALVQGGGPRGTRAIYTNPQVVFDRHLAASATLHRPLDLVVWPEGVLQSHSPFQSGADAAEVAALARRLGATVLVGVEQDVPPDRYLNEVVAWSPRGRIVGTYVKNHLVPFGEYIPWRSFIARFFNVSAVPYDAIPGHGPGFMRTPAGPLAIMISYEVFFDSRARGGVDAGGQILVVPTDTASYRSSQVPAQEVAADRLRAYETGRWLVQVTPTGFSDVVSPDGRVAVRSGLGERDVITASVPRRSGMTVFDDAGEAPWLAAAGAVWLAVAAAALSSRRPDRSIRPSTSSSSAPATSADRRWPRRSSAPSSPAGGPHSRSAPPGW
jgi:apolipoprotein N-acyltransferase